MKKSQTICSTVKSAWHAISRLYNEQAASYGLTASVGFVLLNIDREVGTPATKIAPAMGMEAHSLSRILKNLEEQGYIKRLQDLNDKRLVNVFLTDKGKEAKDVAKKVVKKFNETIKSEVSAEKMAIFFEVMDVIHQVISEKEIYKN